MIYKDEYKDRINNRICKTERRKNVSEELFINSEELFFLGKLMHAKYIDYAYVSSMKEIEINYSLCERETLSSLVTKGMITEDFSGTLKVEEHVKRILQPVFLAQTETSFEISDYKNPMYNSVIRFHLYKKDISLVSRNKATYSIRLVTKETIRSLMVELLRQASTQSTGMELNVSKLNDINRKYVFRCSKIGKQSIEFPVVDYDGKLYRIKDAESLISVSKDELEKTALFILGGL